MTGRFTVVPTNRRPCVLKALGAIAPQVDKVIVIETLGSIAPDPVHSNDIRAHAPGVSIFVDDKPGMSVSRWWNKGLGLAQHFAQRAGLEKWEVAVLNDDVIVPEGWFDAVSHGLRHLQAVAACSGGLLPKPILHTKPGPVNLMTRMQGFAYMLAGEWELRADETMPWWCSDDDLDWTARSLGGMVMIPGFHVDHLYPNGQMTPELHVQAGKDMETFVAKWKERPW